MQPLPFIFIQQDIFANPQTAAAHFCFRSAVQLLQTRLSQIRETKNRAYELIARRSLHAGTVPNISELKCVGKTCCAT